MMELFGIITVVIATQICTWVKLNKLNTHAHKQLHVKLVKSEYILWIISVNIYVEILYYCYVRHHYWGKLGKKIKENSVLFLSTVYECTTITKTNTWRKTDRNEERNSQIYNYSCRF